MRSPETLLRRVRFAPYLKGKGPTFTLKTWDTGHEHRGGPQWAIEYRLTMGEHGRRTVLFEGADFGCSPLDAIDSDACIRSLMSFLTLRPGDTDSEYFEDYTAAQLAYCDAHAEALSCCVADRFGED